eukprot:scaffold83264_cov44-Cyclotella_meneghiniana.AAC.1
MQQSTVEMKRIINNNVLEWRDDQSRWRTEADGRHDALFDEAWLTEGGFWRREADGKHVTMTVDTAWLNGAHGKHNPLRTRMAQTIEADGRHNLPTRNLA